jgi:CDP-diglyceride synthetase
MSTNFHLASMIGSIAFIVLVGSGFIVVLTVPALAHKPVYPMLAVVATALIITPVIGWYVAKSMQRIR